MDETLRHHNPNPILRANPLSKLFFWWLNPVFKKGFKKRLEIDDMYNVVNEDSSEELGDRLEREWNKELEKRKHGGRASLLKAFMRMFGVQYMLLGIIVFFEEGTKVVQPLFLGQLIRFFTPNSTVSLRDAYLFAMGVSVCAVVLAVTHHPYFFSVQRIGMKLRVAACSLLYRKALRLSNTALGQTTTGQIVNLMSNDVNRFDTAAIFIHYLWVGPLQAIPVLIILWIELGPSTLAGFGVLLLLVPVQSWMGKLFSKLRHKTAVHTDERVKVMNEIISGMRVIKMYCWEKPFGDLVGKIRSMESARVKRCSYVRGLIVGPFFVSTKLIVFLTFLSYVLTGNLLTPEKVFVTISIYQAIRLSTTLFIPFAVQFAAETLVTIKRLEKFLLLDELENRGDNPGQNLRPKPEDCCIKMNKVSAKWDKSFDQPTLHDITVNVGVGKLLAVIGPVGAGKSSLLMSILKELPVYNGDISVRGKICFVSQQPWVFSASLRQNIVFGNKFEQTKYDRILKACALNKDIDIMPHGDATQIGDRGVSLSGGQKARVSLARALYTDADVYLLDDPLSAVDAAVGKHLFEKVVEGLLKNKPRILVTHQLQYLKAADEILILKEGECIGQGTFKEISTSGIDFSSLLKPNKDEENQDKSPNVENIGSRVDLENIGSTFSLTSIGTEFEAEKIQLPEEEERRHGTVGWRIYYEYFKAGSGIFIFLILLFLNITAQVAYVASDWWLSHWSNEEEAKHAAIKKDQELRFMYNITNVSIATNVTIPYVDVHMNVYIFSGIIGAVFLFGLLRALMFFKVAVDASMKLHNRMFQRILRAPIAFFDTNPVGRILNRFSKDTGHMDDILPITFFDFIQCFLLIIGIVLVVCIVNPWVFIPIVPLSILFYLVQKYYLTTSRHVKRLEGTTRSPVFSYLSATLQGLHTIRAFGVQEKFIEEFDNHQNLHTEAWFLFLTTSRWLAVRLDWLCVFFVSFVAFGSVLAAQNLDAGLVGLSMTYAMTLMGMFQWAIRQSAEVENQMISVERVLDYARLPTEADLESDKDRKPPPEWPQNGAIRGDKVCLKYSENAPFVLKSLQFSINGKEKIGIVGRTGAGKSSLIAMLFRMVEPEGVIHIDDINIKKLGLHDLRNKISIIPQDPVLFTGSLRKNLDPFFEHEDSNLWSSLEKVQLKSVVEDIPGRLEAEVSEGGINFSVGQRQLICLARAILRQNKILMIDEATANVDPRTDALIQKTIREKFQDCTVLTIAHRLHTIMDSDRVLVMDEGRIAEFDQPYTLLTDKNSEFCKMALQTGQSEFEHLLEIAQKSYKSHDASGGMESVSHIDDGGHVDKDCDRSESVVTDKEVSSFHPSSDPVSEQPCSDSDKNSDELKTDLNKNMSVEPDSSSENKTEPVLHIENYDNNKLQNEKENSEISSRSSSSSSESNDRSETQDMFHTVEEDDPLLTNDIAGHKEPDPSLTPAQSNNDADHIESDPDVTNENTALLNISKNKSLLQKNQEPSEDDSNVLMESFDSTSETNELINSLDV